MRKVENGMWPPARRGYRGLRPGGNAEIGLGRAQPNRMRKAQVNGSRNQLPAAGRERKIDAGIQRTEVGRQRTEVGRQRTEVGGQKTEVGRQKTEVGGQRQLNGEVGMRNAEIKGRSGQVRAVRAAGSRKKTGAGIQRTEVGGQKTVPKSLKTAAVKKVAATGKPTAGAKSRKIDVRKQRAENAPLQQRTQAGKRPAESKKKKRKVTI